MRAQTTLLSLIPLAALVVAAPLELDARYSSNEVVYLSLCDNGGPEAPTYLEGDYYTNIGNSHSGQYPDARSNPVSGPNYYTAPTIEGNTYGLYFSSSGVTFTSKIDAGANNRAVGAYAGTGNNGKAFTCYRDDGSTLWSKSDGYHTASCRKQYYCRPN